MYGDGADQPPYHALSELQLLPRERLREGEGGGTARVLEGCVEDGACQMKPNPFWHQLWDFSRLVGLRDRLRCPNCKKVGTWKPHGGWLDVEDRRKVRRWICKWCGNYFGPEGYRLAVQGKSSWILWQDRTPADPCTLPMTQVTGDPWYG